MSVGSLSSSGSPRTPPGIGASARCSPTCVRADSDAASGFAPKTGSRRRDGVQSTAKGVAEMRTHLLATVAIVLATAGCTAESVDRSGGVQTETLVLASNDGINVGAPGVAHFVERVAKLSAGRLQIDVRPD